MEGGEFYKIVWGNLKNHHMEFKTVGGKFKKSLAAEFKIVGWVIQKISVAEFKIVGRRGGI